MSKRPDVHIGDVFYRIEPTDFKADERDNGYKPICVCKSCDKCEKLEVLK